MPAYPDTLDPINRRFLEKYGGLDYVPPGVDTTSAVTTVAAEPSATATIPEGLHPTNERLFKKFAEGGGVAEAAGQISGAYRGAKAAYREKLPGMPWPWRPMEWMFQEKTGGIARAQDLLLRDEYALAGATKTALDKWYYGDKTIPWGDVLREYDRGWKGENKELLAELITTPRYGEPLTALAKSAEHYAAHRTSPTALLPPPGKALEQDWPELEGSTPGRAFTTMFSDRIGSEGYGRSDTAVPPVAHGAFWGIAASPWTWLRGPGPTRKGSAAKLKENVSKGPLKELLEAGPEYYGDYLLGGRRWDRKARSWLDKIGEFEKGGAKLPAMADPLTNAEQGLYAMLRTAGGDPIWSGRPLYALGQNVKEAIRHKQTWAKTVDSIAQAVSTQWRPLYSKELGGEIAPVLTDAEWGHARGAITKAVGESQFAGTSAVDEMLKALDGVPIAKKDDFIRGLDVLYHSGQAPDEIAPVIEALRPWRERIWPAQAQKLGAELTGTPYFPHIAAPDNRTGLNKLVDLFKSPKAPAALGTVDEAVDVGRVVKTEPMAEEALRMLDPDFVKHRRYVGSYLDAAKERPELAATHPVLAAAERTRQGAAAEALMGSLDDIATEFGQQFRTADELAQAADILNTGVPKGYVMVTTDPWAAPRGFGPYRALDTADELLMAGNSGAPVQMMPVDMVEFADRFSRTLSAREMAPLLKHYRGYLGHWKVSQLGIYPGYWTRNLVTEHWWNWLRNPEILTPRNWYRAEKIRQGGKGTLDTVYGPMSYEEVRQGFLPRIAHQGMLGAEEVDITKRHVLRTPMEKFTAPAAKGMEKMSGPIEDTPRLMQGIWELENGATIEQAAKSVHDFHINYAELPPFQRTAIKTIAPFSTFPIGATKILGREMVRQPHKIAATGRVSRLTELLAGLATDSQPPSPDEIPDYIEAQEPLWLGQPRDEETGKRRDEYIPQLNYTPLGMLGEMLGYGQSIDQAMSMMGPAGTAIGLKAGEMLTGYTPEGEAYEVAEGRDWFKGRPMLRFPGERTNLGGFSVSPKLKSALLGMVPYGRAYSEIERLNPFNIFGSEDERAYQWGWGDAEPGWEGDITGWGASEIGQPTLERTGPYRAYPQPDLLTRLTGFATGLRGYEGDRHEEWVRKQRERERLINTLKYKLKDPNISPDDKERYYDQLQGIFAAQRNR